MSRGGNRDNNSTVIASALDFSGTLISLGTAALVVGNVLTYNGSTIVISAPAVPPTPTLAQVLTAGNSTGVNSIVMNGGAGQTLTVGAAVNIGMSSSSIIAWTGNVTETAGVNAIFRVGNAGGASGANGVSYGNLCNTSTSTSSLCVGYNNVLGTLCHRSMLFGNGCTSTNNNADSIGIGGGVQITAPSSIGIGINGTSASGTSSINIGDGCLNHANNSNCVLLGRTISNTTSGATGIVAVGGNITCSAGIADVIYVGRNAFGLGTVTNSIVMGVGSNCGGTTTTIVGSATTTASTNNNNTLIGGGSSNATAGNVGCSSLGQGIVFTAGANSTGTTALGAGAVVPAGSVNRLYGTVLWAANTSAGGTALMVDAAGRIYPLVSSIRYKHNVRDISLAEARKVLEVRHVKYNLKQGYCGCPNNVLDENGVSIPNPCDGTCCEEVGVIAEELANLGLDDYVVFEPDPTPGREGNKRCRGVKYERLVTPLLTIVRDQDARLRALEAQIVTISARLL